MTSSQGTSSSPDKIEVAEIFWYGCNHCYNFDPLIDEWQEKQASDVAFVRIPVMWNPTNPFLGKKETAPERLKSRYAYPASILMMALSREARKET
jgi:hypothetical protein